ncbi:hypothetical protein [uncultured Maricaulis sp.]|uniref:hypothetical protein n=1 Tax=uncultured Maricaulis sp. TaxID=174710 RepID=UPI0030DAA274
MRARPNALRRYLPAIVVSLAAICMPLLSAFEPVRGDEAAAIFPPGWTHADTVLATAEADLAFVRFGAFANIGIVRIVDQSSLTDLRRAGALLLLPPGALGGCLLPRDNLTPFDTNATSIGIST